MDICGTASDMQGGRKQQHKRAVLALTATVAPRSRPAYTAAWAPWPSRTSSPVSPRMSCGGGHPANIPAVSYTHLTLPTTRHE